MVCLYNVFKCLLTNKSKLTQEYLKSNLKDINTRFLYKSSKENIITNISFAVKNQRDGILCQ